MRFPGARLMSPTPKVVQAVRLSQRPSGRPSVMRGMALFVTVTLYIAASGPPSELRTQEDLLAANVDTTISPGDDFYQHATGAWLRQHPIPHDQARWGIANVASDEVYVQ